MSGGFAPIASRPIARVGDVLATLRAMRRQHGVHTFAEIKTALDRD